MPDLLRAHHRPGRPLLMSAPIAYPIAIHGTWFATRQRAAEIRAIVEHALTQRADRTVILDFTDVEAITGGFADELVAKLLAEHGDRVTVTAANEDIAAVIQLVLSRRTA